MVLVHRTISSSAVVMPTLQPMQPMVTATLKRTYGNGHAYHINSLSFNADGETYLSADDLRIHIWHLNTAQQAYNIRMYAIHTYGYVIHEFDPWFNYRAAEYMVRNGWDAFQAWYDHECWYPLGRHVGSTTYPGLQLTAWAIYEVLQRVMPTSLNDVCVLIPAGFGAVAAHFARCAEALAGVGPLLISVDGVDLDAGAVRSGSQVGFFSTQRRRHCASVRCGTSLEIVIHLPAPCRATAAANAASSASDLGRRLMVGSSICIHLSRHPYGVRRGTPTATADQKRQ